MFSDPQRVWYLEIDALTLQNVNAEVVQYRGQRAVHLSPRADAEGAKGHLMAVLKGSDFKDGTIEISVAGAPETSAPPAGRGFVGIAFRIDSNVSGFEYVYLRPTNGRADDQLRRNHSTQYASFPDYPFDLLRKESPEMYESYVDFTTWRVDGIQVSYARQQGCPLHQRLRTAVSNRERS